MFDKTGTSQDRENTGSFFHHKRGMQGTASLLGGATVFIFKRQKICLSFCQKRKKLKFLSSVKVSTHISNQRAGS